MQVNKHQHHSNWT